MPPPRSRGMVCRAGDPKRVNQLLTHRPSLAPWVLGSPFKLCPPREVLFVWRWLWAGHGRPWACTPYMVVRPGGYISEARAP